MVRSSSDKSRDQQHKRKYSAARSRRPAKNPAFPLGEQPIAAVPLAMAPPAALPSDHELYEERCLVLIKLLHSCADAAAKEEVALLSVGLEKVIALASADGEPIQRLAAAFADALALRAVQPMRGVCAALQLTLPLPFPVSAAARRHYDELCPFLRLAAAAANHAVVEVMRAERGAIHVVDLGGAASGQWLELVRLLAARPEGPPCRLRLTVVNCHDEFLDATAALLAPEAEKLRVRLQLHLVKSHIDELLSLEPLGIKSGEALVVSSTLQMHRLLAVEVDAAAAAGDRKGKSPAAVATAADALLRALRELSPRLVVLTEQQADHNRADFTQRFANALGHYAALFDALEEAASRGSPERRLVERLLLREEIRDIVAGGDGALRRERHERMERWGARMGAAGFAAAALSYNALVQTARMAQQLSGGSRLYTVVKDDSGCFFLLWRSIPMFSVSTWRPARGGGSPDDGRRPASDPSSSVAAPAVVVLD